MLSGMVNGSSCQGNGFDFFSTCVDKYSVLSEQLLVVRVGMYFARSVLVILGFLGPCCFALISMMVYWVVFF